MSSDPSRSFFEGSSRPREHSEEMYAPARPIPERGPAAAGAVFDVEAAFQEHASGVRRFLGRIGLAPTEAEDVTSETFLTAYEIRAKFDASRPVRPWLLGIAAKLAQRHRRRTWVRRLLSLRLEREPDAAEAGRDPLASMIEAEDAERVNRALEGLPEKKRTLLVLREYEGLSAEEIGFALDMPANTVYSALHYARKELLKQYRRLMLMEAVR